MPLSYAQYLKIPKVELHLHLDGSLRPKTVRELAGAAPLDKLIAPDDCKSLNQYLEAFELPSKVLQSKAALQRVLQELLEDLAKEGVVYAEIRFAPSIHMRGGMTQDEVVRTLANVVNTSDSPLQSSLILCCMRGETFKTNVETVRIAKKYLGRGVCAVDLAGAEALYPTSDYEDVFEIARKSNIPTTIHAGEAAGPESMWAAIELGASRIGHGIAAITDERLTQHLVEHNICLEMCPVSNCQTKAVPTAQQHPIKKLFDRGVKVTINTDNRTVSNTSLFKEYNLLMQTFGLSLKDIRKMNQYALDSSFMVQ